MTNHNWVFLNAADMQIKIPYLKKINQEKCKTLYRPLACIIHKTNITEYFFMNGNLFT